MTKEEELALFEAYEAWCDIVEGGSVNVIIKPGTPRGDHLQRILKFVQKGLEDIKHLALYKAVATLAKDVAIADNVVVIYSLFTKEKIPDFLEEAAEKLRQSCRLQNKYDVVLGRALVTLEQARSIKADARVGDVITLLGGEVQTISWAEIYNILNQD